MVANGAIAHVNETCKNNEHQSSKGASDCPPEELPSPSTARQEQLIARFAGTIINAQNKMLQLDIDQGKVSKLTEKQKLDKHRMEARYLMDAQLKVDATKKRREMEREAINKMEGIAQLNLESMRETEDFMKRMENVSSEELRKLGLFLKAANEAIAYDKEPCKANSKGPSDCPPPEQLPSPSRARHEQLVARFEGTIINAQNKMLQLDIDQGKLDNHRMEARYLMDAQLEVDATKKRREMEREAINKMEVIAQLNLESMRETEDFMKRMENVSSEELQKLGLFLKVDDVADFMEFSC
ncbi:hypothetical protein J5N97_011191 [Dioscorea zingiberensis]|uniref:Uncharacterized protein n=1 Tax=Dioscorea zingiberensis TaxID=325984 RepID=A0A9D5HNH1_9LILI|nr:hypothetical protein J5N97_011191 [Dioscorea zingiberensis]